MFLNHTFVAVCVSISCSSAFALDVFGTGGDDTLYVGECWLEVGGTYTNFGACVYLNGTSHSITVASGEAVVVYAGRGDDYVEWVRGIIQVEPKLQVRKLTVLHTAVTFGQFGDDFISGSRFQDFIEGGPGNDIIFGFEGKDIIAGFEECGGFCCASQSQSDHCFGGPDGDTIECGGSANGDSSVGTEDKCFSENAIANCDIVQICL